MAAWADCSFPSSSKARSSGRRWAARSGSHDSSLFPLLGIAAFLGAGYRVPLAAIVFVAETTGRPGFVVPGLIAAATSQLVMGRVSITPYQHDSRTGPLARHLALPITTAVRTDAVTALTSVTLEDLFPVLATQRAPRSVPVVGPDGSFLGVAQLKDFGAVPRDQWARTTAGQIMRSDGPEVDLNSSLEEAVRCLETTGSDQLAVTEQGEFVGVISMGDILRLDAIFDQAEATARADPTTAD